MLILQILLIILLSAFLFLLFLPTKFKFRFKNRAWEVKMENLFFRYSFGSDGKEFASFIKLRAKDKPDKSAPYTPKSETKETPPVFDTPNERISPKNDYIKEEERPKTCKKASEKPKPRKETEKSARPQEEKTVEDWLDFARETWEKENKTVKLVLKFLLNASKLSLKLLSPAKIAFNADGGLGEPAETGWLYSLFVLANAPFTGNARVTLNYTPRFYESKWDFAGGAEYVFSVARLLLFTLALLFLIPYIQIISTLWRRRRAIF